MTLASGSVWALLINKPMRLSLLLEATCNFIWRLQEHQLTLLSVDVSNLHYNTHAVTSVTHAISRWMIVLDRMFNVYYKWLSYIHHYLCHLRSNCRRKYMIPVLARHINQKAHVLLLPHVCRDAKCTWDFIPFVVTLTHEKMMYGNGGNP